MTYVNFDQSEWEAVVATAKTSWIKTILGDVPTRAKVRETITNPYKVSLLDWISFAILIIIMVFTCGKVGLAALPFAQNLANALTHGQPVAPFILTGFSATAIVLYSLLATPALLYFQLLNSSSDEIHRQKQESTARLLRTRPINLFGVKINLYRVSLEYLAPRFPALLVYGTGLWLIVLSTYEFKSVFEIFAAYLPVAAEIAFAHLVGEIIRKRTEFSRVIDLKLEDMRNTYNERLLNFRNDEDFLTILYQVFRQRFFDIRRKDERGRPTQPNKYLQNSNENVESILLDEYARLNAGRLFAERVKVRTHVVEPEKVTPVEATRRVPPNGAKSWNWTTLQQDLKLLNLDPHTIKETQISELYEPGYDARKAFRSRPK